MNTIAENIIKILANQEKYINEKLLEPISIPEDKPLYPDCNTCKSCNHNFLSNTKKIKYTGYNVAHRCKIWNNMIIKEEIKCDFYSPIMFSGLQQLMFSTVRLAYPNIVAKEFKEYSL